MCFPCGHVRAQQIGDLAICAMLPNALWVSEGHSPFTVLAARSMRYPLVIEHGNGKSPTNGGFFNRTTTYFYGPFSIAMFDYWMVSREAFNHSLCRTKLLWTAVSLKTLRAAFPSRCMSEQSAAASSNHVQVATFRQWFPRGTETLSQHLLSTGDTSSTIKVEPDVWFSPIF